MLKKTYIIYALLWTILVSLLVLGIPSCSDKGNNVDLSGHEVELNIQRMEGDIFNLKNEADYFDLYNRDSIFMSVYTNGIMESVTGGYRVPGDQRIQAILQFVSNKDMQHLYSTVDSTFHDFDKLEAELNEAFSYMNYYFGDSIVPKMYTFVSPFYYNTVSFEGSLGIGLDMYLGANFSPYGSPGLNFPQYKIKKFRKSSLVPDVVKSQLMTKYPKSEKDRRLLSEMIYEGKILYAMDKLLPETPDSLKMGYLKGQIEWCEKEEQNIWNTLWSQELLFASDEMTYRGVLHDGPFSKGLNIPQESSPRIAVWAGWQIVRKYMKANPNVTLLELMQNENSEAILKQSAYKP